MGGRSPHLGLVLTEGAFRSYSVAGRDEITSSDTRGTFLFHPSTRPLKPGESIAFGWTCFWHQGWEDFFAQAQRRSAQFVRLQMPRLTFFPGESVSVAVEGQHAKGARFDASLPFTAAALGEQSLTLNYGDGLVTRAVINVVPPLHDLVQARVNFIAQRQQVNKAGDPLDGAYLVYDNDLDKIVRTDWGTDHNEGRERIRMGVLMAR